MAVDERFVCFCDYKPNITTTNLFGMKKKEMHRERERVRGYEVNRLGEDGKRVIKKRVNNESIQKKRNRGWCRTKINKIQRANTHARDLNGFHWRLEFN